MTTDTKFWQKLGVLLAVGALAILLVFLACLRPGRHEVFTGATITLYMDLGSGKYVPSSQPVAVLNVSDPNRIEQLLAFFPDLGRRSDEAAGWQSRATIDLTKPDGGKVGIALPDDLEVWSEGNGDWPVEGDLKAFLLNLQKEHAATAPAPNGASTLPAVSSKP